MAQPGTTPNPKEPNEEGKPPSRSKLDDLYGYFDKNTRDIIAYIFLFIGIILLLFQSFWGGLIIGIIAGIYFSEPIVYWLKHLQHAVEEEGIARSLIFAGVVLGLFIGAPGIFIGAAIAIGLKYILVNER